MAELAESLSLDKNEWNSKITQVEKDLNNEISHTHDLMAQMQVGGFPTFIIEKDNRLMALLHSSYYGKTEEWKQLLSSSIHLLLF